MGAFNEVLTSSNKFRGKSVSLDSDSLGPILRLRVTLLEKDWIDVGATTAGTHYTPTLMCWQPRDAPFQTYANLFSDEIKTWNKETFGNIFLRKKKMDVCLLGAQRAIETNPLHFLQNLETSLIFD
ncbi:hypothetical protein ACSBR2_009000 [Camellia fascicularis]